MYLSPVWNKGWLGVWGRGGGSGVGGVGGAGLYTLPPPHPVPSITIPNPHFTLLTGVLSPFCFLFSDASVKDGGGSGGERRFFVFFV